MVDTQKILKSTLKEAFTFKRYQAFSIWARIFLNIVLSPLYLLGIIITLIYQVNIYFYKLFYQIARYIKDTIEENNVHLSLMIIIYIITYPIKFLFDILVIGEMIILTIVHFIFVSVLYLASFGGIKYMPLIFEATTDVWKMIPLNKVKWFYEAIIAVLIVALLIFLMSIPRIVEVSKLKKEKTVDAAEIINLYLNYRGVEGPYQVKEVFYFENEVISNYFIVQIRHTGMERFFLFYEDHFSLEILNYVKYENHKKIIYKSKKYKLNAKIINESVKKLYGEKP